eukprot:5369177-Pyramimonas_sp.AAC.1
MRVFLSHPRCSRRRSTARSHLRSSGSRAQEYEGTSWSGGGSVFSHRYAAASTRRAPSASAYFASLRGSDYVAMESPVGHRKAAGEKVRRRRGDRADGYAH